MLLYPLHRRAKLRPSLPRGSQIPNIQLQDARLSTLQVEFDASTGARRKDTVGNHGLPIVPEYLHRRPIHEDVKLYALAIRQSERPGMATGKFLVKADIAGSSSVHKQFRFFRIDPDDGFLIRPLAHSKPNFSSTARIDFSHDLKRLSADTFGLQQAVGCKNVLTFQARMLLAQCAKFYDGLLHQADPVCEPLEFQLTRDRLRTPPRMRWHLGRILPVNEPSKPNATPIGVRYIRERRGSIEIFPVISPQDLILRTLTGKGRTIELADE